VHRNPVFVFRSLALRIRMTCGFDRVPTVAPQVLTPDLDKGSLSDNRGTKVVLPPLRTHIIGLLQTG
jgi:hypothetical protein